MTGTKPSPATGNPHLPSSCLVTTKIPCQAQVSSFPCPEIPQFLLPGASPTQQSMPNLYCQLQLLLTSPKTLFTSPLSCLSAHKQIANATNPTILPNFSSYFCHAQTLPASTSSVPTSSFDHTQAHSLCNMQQSQHSSTISNPTHPLHTSKPSFHSNS